MPVFSSGGAWNKVYDSKALAAAAASVDTGAGGIPGGFDLLRIFILARTDEAVTLSGLTVIFNNGTGGNYDIEFARGLNVTASAVNSRAQVGLNVTCLGSSATANNFATFIIDIPFYAETTAFKTGHCWNAMAEAVAASCLSDNIAMTYRSTGAITRVKVLPTTAAKNLVAGSHVICMVI